MAYSPGEPGGQLGILLLKGAMQLVKAEWLVAQAEANVPIMSRQDAPPAALFAGEEALGHWQDTPNDGGEDMDI